MQVYGLKNCDKTRAAMRALAAAGHAPELVDIRETPLQDVDLQAFLGAFGGDLLNRRSTTWRGLSAPERAGDPAALIAAHPTLMKRPVVREGSRITLGWRDEAQVEWLGTPG